VTHSLPGALAHLEPALDHYGYLALAGIILVESFGIPAPGVTILVVASVYAGTGRMNVFAVALIGFLTAVIGDNIGYLIGRQLGQRAVLKWGRYVGLTRERFERAEEYFRKHGGKVVVIARFIDGLRQVNGVLAGLAEMPWRRFFALQSLGAILWVAVWVPLGYLGGNHIDTVYAQAVRYQTYLLVLFVAAVALVIARHLVLRWRRRSVAGEDQGLAGRAGSAKP
jgi:membrane protein DedA with SNARE-associated domain